MLKWLGKKRLSPADALFENPYRTLHSLLWNFLARFFEMTLWVRYAPSREVRVGYQ